MSALTTATTLLPLLASEGKDNPVADFSDTPMWLSVVKALFIFVYLLISTLLVIWFERRVIGRMQQRPGPNRNGPFGLLQTLADGMKSMLKEDLKPKNADSFVFTLAPLITATMCFVGFSIMPLAGEVNLFGHKTPLQLTDLPVAILMGSNEFEKGEVTIKDLILGGQLQEKKKSVAGKDREAYLAETRTVQTTVPLEGCIRMVREVLGRHTTEPGR